MNKASKVVIFRVALDGSDYIPPAWDELNPEKTSNQSCSGVVYDILNNRHEIEIYFRRTSPNSFEWHAITDGSNIAGGVWGVPVECASGSFEHDCRGFITKQEVGSSLWDFLGPRPGQERYLQTIYFDISGCRVATGGQSLDSLQRDLGGFCGDAYRPTDFDGFMRLIMSVCGNALFSDDDGELVIHTGLESTIGGELREMPDKASRRLSNGQ